MADTHADYLRSLGQKIRSDAEVAKLDLDSVPGSERRDSFLQGRLIAYVEVLSLMQQEAQALAVPLRDLSLDGFDPERDLL